MANRSLPSCCILQFLDENDMKKHFNWINLIPMYSSENNSWNAEINYHLYILQEVKAKYFMKLNEKGPNEDIHESNL